MIGALIASLAFPATATTTSITVDVDGTTAPESLPDPETDPDFKVKGQRYCVGSPATATRWDTNAPISAEDSAARADVEIHWEQQRDGSWTIRGLRITVDNGLEHMDIWQEDSLGFDGVWTYAGIPLTGKIVATWDCEKLPGGTTDETNTRNAEWLKIDASSTGPVAVDSGGVLCWPLRGCFS